MTKLEILNRRMLLLLEREVSISCEEYDTYKALLEAVEVLRLLEAVAHPYHRPAQAVLESLK